LQTSLSWFSTPAVSRGSDSATYTMVSATANEPRLKLATRPVVAREASTGFVLGR
jgi:hypothetical protein